MSEGLQLASATAVPLHKALVFILSFFGSFSFSPRPSQAAHAADAAALWQVLMGYSCFSASDPLKRRARLHLVCLVAILQGSTLLEQQQQQQKQQKQQQASAERHLDYSIALASRALASECRFDCLVLSVAVPRSNRCLACSLPSVCPSVRLSVPSSIDSMCRSVTVPLHFLDSVFVLLAAF